MISSSQAKIPSSRSHNTVTPLHTGAAPTPFWLYHQDSPPISDLRRDLRAPISVNQEEQELRLMVSKRTTWLGSEPWLMATHTRGYSCSGTTSISNTFRGLGRGKSKCCNRKRARDDVKLSVGHFHLFDVDFFSDKGVRNCTTSIMK